MPIYPQVIEHMEGDLLDCVNVNGAFGDAPICDDTSSNRSWVVSSGLPPWGDRVGEVSLCTPPPALVAFLHLLFCRQKFNSYMILELMPISLRMWISH